MSADAVAQLRYLFTLLGNLMKHLAIPREIYEVEFDRMVLRLISCSFRKRFANQSSADSQTQVRVWSANLPIIALPSLAKIIPQTNYTSVPALRRQKKCTGASTCQIKDESASRSLWFPPQSLLFQRGPACGRSVFQTVNKTPMKLFLYQEKLALNCE